MPERTAKEREAYEASLRTVDNHLQRLVTLGALTPVRAAVLLARAAEAGNEAWRAMQPMEGT